MLLIDSIECSRLHDNLVSFAVLVVLRYIDIQNTHTYIRAASSLRRSRGEKLIDAATTHSTCCGPHPTSLTATIRPSD